MNDYKKMYYHLFNRVTDALEALENHNCSKAAEILCAAQQEAEELYLTAAEPKTPDAQ